MKLVDDWKRVLRRARSVRWAIVTGLLGALQVGIDYLDVVIQNRSLLALATMLATAAIPIARVVAQENLKGDGDG